jgi:hypothetical protein
MLDKIFGRKESKDKDLSNKDLAALFREQDAPWLEKERRLREHVIDIEQEVSEVGALLEQYKITDLSSDEAKARVAATRLGKRGIIGYPGFPTIGDKAAFLNFYKVTRSKTPVLNPSVIQRLLDTHEGIDYPGLQEIVEDIEQYNEMVVLAHSLNLIPAEEVEERLKNVGLVDIQQLIADFRPIINQSSWNY